MAQSAVTTHVEALPASPTSFNPCTRMSKEVKSAREERVKRARAASTSSAEFTANLDWTTLSLNEEAQHQLMRLFALLDKDHDGRLDALDLPEHWAEVSSALHADAALDFASFVVCPARTQILVFIRDALKDQHSSLAYEN